MTTDAGYQRSRLKPFDANEHTVTLLVLSEPKLDQLRSVQRFVALVSCIDNRPIRFQLSAECSGEPFSYGDRLIAQGKFYVPARPLNPGEFDFGAYLQRQNIYLNFKTHRDVPAMVTAQNQGNPFVAVALAARHRILQALQEGLQDDTEVAQTIQGMILGARAETNPALKQLFRDTGTIHCSRPAVCKWVFLRDSRGVACVTSGSPDNRSLCQLFLSRSPIAPSPALSFHRPGRDPCASARRRNHK